VHLLHTLPVRTTQTHPEVAVWAHTRCSRETDCSRNGPECI